MSQNQNIKFIKDYAVHSKTCAILNYELADGVIISRILEENQTFFCTKTPSEILLRSCRHYGGSYEERREITKMLLNVSHRPPVVVCAKKGLYFFPTSGVKHRECCWFNHYFILKFQAFRNNQTMIFFNNRTSITIPMSATSFEIQCYRTAQLRHILLQQQTESKTRKFIVMPASHSNNFPSSYEQLLDHLQQQEQEQQRFVHLIDD
ncbi:MAG: competence protein ComK [Bacilli bacterium]